MHRYPAIALLAVALLANARPSQAQLENPTPLEILNVCRPGDILQRGDSELPAPIAAALAGNDARIAISSCSEWYETKFHYFARALFRHQNGICEAKETEVFPGGPDDVVTVKIIEGSTADSITLRSLTETPPAAWTALGYKAKSDTVALATTAECPAMDDPRYIATTNVSDQRLKQIQAFWQKTTSSPETFDQALGEVPFEFGVFLPWIRQGQKALLGQFREQAIAGNAALHSISCKQNTCTASFGFSCKQHSCWLYRWIEFAAGPQGLRPVRWGGYLVS